MQFALAGQSADGGEVSSCGLHGQSQAGADAVLAVHQDRASPAFAGAAAVFGFGQTEIVPQGLQKGPVDRHRELVVLSVDAERNRSGFHGCLLCLASANRWLSESGVDQNL